MAQWGNTDDAANSVLWATAQVNLPSNTVNQSTLFENTTDDVFKNNDVAMPIAVGQFGVDAKEVTAARAEGSGDRSAHAGWVLRTTGTGGRAGRTQTEVLVAMSTIGTDSEDTVYEDYVLRITTQPSNTTANTSDGENATFTVVAASVPTGASLTYAWTYANGDAIATGANVGVKTAATLTVNSAVQTTNAAFKVTVSATGADSVTSANATLTITT